ncbi:hypothetical protein K488DRAFT_55342 [Vararia minispora EC-137]|uniref:Uncharacterized protein n=1 Tax=Vararia minispora EC-137 TaxID=1314806 RepID=A0ACB8QDM4_9AGAM|nr:hypothetical protein K488DRAFT_55342 [Vararia minispora EC-137]
MKNVIGDAVGNMSISPSYRDVVLAARKGLFIIDLEAHDKVPRFLPQGGTWDVADVQWNPHPARAEYVVSTSSEKLLIWNLALSGPTSIEHVLHSHYRSITDINWHTQDPNIVVSTGIDAWLWAWDLRTIEKPVMGLCAFNSGGTQVKWNRQDGHILASSHMNQVLIWDRRKGSIPVNSINAHAAKIYGIDWAHNNSRELITCSLDKTIKVWDIHALPSADTGARAYHPSDTPTNLTPCGAVDDPRTVINTSYPVWRARDLPFGKGVISLPQRGSNTLEMWSTALDDPEPEYPVKDFDGHSDVVKEFVWRRGGRDWGNFQLITWSKDKTLRFWPIDPSTMGRAGQPVSLPVPPRAQGYGDPKVTYHEPPAQYEPRAFLSAPVGHHGILDEVRAAPRARHHRHTHRNGHRRRHPPSPAAPSNQSLHSSLRSGAGESTPEQTPTLSTIPIPISGSRRPATTMSRGNVLGRSAKVEALTWLSSVRVTERPRDGGSSGTGSGQNSGSVSRIGSRSRPQSREPGIRKRSSSRSRWIGNEEEGLNLQDEITTVLNKLVSSKIKLEKHDLSKKRTCTLGLNGPWGEGSSVFVRVSFTFPKEYPHPSSTSPTVDIEPTPLIPLRSRAHMLRRLRSILENRRPCFEACLRFLLFGDEGQQDRYQPYMDFDTSSDEDEPVHASAVRKGRDTTVTMLHNDKNIAEPRTSQAVFGPDGNLVCFSRVPPRIVRNPLNELSTSPSLPSRSQGASTSDSIPRLFKSPALISDAVRHLVVASQDHAPTASTSSSLTEDGDNILPIMTNLLLFSRLKQRRLSASESSTRAHEDTASYALLQTRLSTVSLHDESNAVKLGRDMAAETVFIGSDPVQICGQNAEVALRYGHQDRARFFRTMKLLFETGSARGLRRQETWGGNPLVNRLVAEIYDELSLAKDVQMLAIFACLLLKVYHPSLPPRGTVVRVVSSPSPTIPPISRTPSGDYFTHRRRSSRVAPLSPGWPRATSSPVANMSTSVGSVSSRGSWSSLFHTSNMRQLVGATAEQPPPQIPQTALPGITDGIPVPGGENRKTSMPKSPRGKRDISPPPRRGWDSPASSSAGSRLSVTFVTNQLGTKAPTFSQIVSTKAHCPAKVVVVDLRDKLRVEKEAALDIFKPEFIQRLLDHIVAYAEILFRWQLPIKRIELLKSVDHSLLTSQGFAFDIGQSAIGVAVLCTRCGSDAAMPGNRACNVCAARLTMPLCSICRLPVKGLSYTCVSCRHASHINCWKKADMPACAAGCGCLCKANNAPDQLTSSPLPIALRLLPAL